MVCLGSAADGRPGQRAKLAKLVRDSVICRSRDLSNAGIHRRYLAIACGQGLIKRVARDCYAPAGSERGRRQELSRLAVVFPAVSLPFPRRFISRLLRQEPPQVWMASAQGEAAACRCAAPKDCPLLREALTQGVVNLKVDGVPVRVYSPMKTIADCFKFRHRSDRHCGRRTARQCSYKRSTAVTTSPLCSNLPCREVYTDAFRPEDNACHGPIEKAGS